MRFFTRKTTSASVSKPIISGVPSHIRYVAEITVNPGSFVSNAVNKALSEELAILKKSMGMAHVEYGSIVRDFNIEWDARTKSFVYVVKKPSAQRAREIEYGTLEEPAARVQTTMAVHRARELESKIQKYLDKELGL